MQAGSSTAMGLGALRRRVARSCAADVCGSWPSSAGERRPGIVPGSFGDAHRRLRVQAVRILRAAALTWYGEAADRLACDAYLDGEAAPNGIAVVPALECQLAECN